MPPLDNAVSSVAASQTVSGIADRAAGAIIGGLIGDALGVGPHWYYDINEQKRDYGDWINGYTAPRSDRYHAGLKPGQLSQTGYITRLLLDSLIAKSGYDQADFTSRLDTELLARTDGTPNSGPGGFTHKSVRAAYAKRASGIKGWGDLAGNTDTTEGAERILAIAALYARDGNTAAKLAYDNIRLLQTEPTVVAFSTAYAGVIAALVRGEKLDGNIATVLKSLAAPGVLPEETFPLGNSPLSAVGYYAGLADNPDVKVEPAASIANVYGLSCAFYYVLPGAYYLAARFRRDFESAVLHALNGGGQNLARAYLTGSLVGAQVGLSGIPQRFIDGLENAPALIAQAKQIGELAAKS